MHFVNRKKLLLSLAAVIVIYFVIIFIRGPFQFEYMSVSDGQLVGEAVSDFNNYSIKTFYTNGPIGYLEYSYIGSLYQGDNFIRNVFWVGPSGNDFFIEWKSESTIKINNLTRSQPSVTLNVEEDTYDFRGFPF